MPTSPAPASGTCWKRCAARVGSTRSSSTTTKSLPVVPSCRPHGAAWCAASSPYRRSRGSSASRFPRPVKWRAPSPRSSRPSSSRWQPRGIFGNMIKRESLLSLEAYARERNAFRTRVLEHKKRRTVRLGNHLTLLFEDELTIRYQVQEMLRIERIFDEEGIQSELAAYNPLVPDGHNWKATMLIEYPDPDERKRQL